MSDQNRISPYNINTISNEYNIKETSDENKNNIK